MDCCRDTLAQKVLLFLDYTPFSLNDLDIEGQKTVIGHLAVVSITYVKIILLHTAEKKLIC